MKMNYCKGKVFNTCAICPPFCCLFCTLAAAAFILRSCSFRLIQLFTLEHVFTLFPFLVGIISPVLTSLLARVLRYWTEIFIAKVVGSLIQAIILSEYWIEMFTITITTAYMRGASHRFEYSTVSIQAKYCIASAVNNWSQLFSEHYYVTD